MTLFAVIVLAVWALGIVTLAVAHPHVAREHLELDVAWQVNPAATAAVVALVTVFWPAAAGLAWLVDRGRR